ERNDKSRLANRDFHPRRERCACARLISCSLRDRCQEAALQSSRDRKAPTSATSAPPRQSSTTGWRQSSILHSAQLLRARAQSARDPLPDRLCLPSTSARENRLC